MRSTGGWKREARCEQGYQELVNIMRNSVKQAQAIAKLLHQVATPEAGAVAHQVRKNLPLVEQAMQQTMRRVMNEGEVSAQEKLASPFEPHIDIIRLASFRGKTCLV